MCLMSLEIFLGTRLSLGTAGLCNYFLLVTKCCLNHIGAFNLTGAIIDRSQFIKQGNEILIVVVIYNTWLEKPSKFFKHEIANQGLSVAFFL